MRRIPTPEDKVFYNRFMNMLRFYNPYANHGKDGANHAMIKRKIYAQWKKAERISPARFWIRVNAVKGKFPGAPWAEHPNAEE